MNFTIAEIMLNQCNTGNDILSVLDSIAEDMNEETEGGELVAAGTTTETDYIDF
jgi:hypothetical protein